ncbi:hypothetical protein ACFXTI_003425 [Malus domestica]
MEHSLDDEFGTNDNDFVFEEKRDTGIAIEHAKISSLKAPTVTIEFPRQMHGDTNEVEGNVNYEQGNNVGATFEANRMQMGIQDQKRFEGKHREAQSETFSKKVYLERGSGLCRHRNFGKINVDQ